MTRRGLRVNVEKKLLPRGREPRKENIAQFVKNQNFTRISNLADDAVVKNAKIAVGGTLMHLMQEEIFGPVVPVVTYERLDENHRLHLQVRRAAGALYHKSHLPFGGAHQGGTGSYPGGGDWFQGILA